MKSLAATAIASIMALVIGLVSVVYADSDSAREVVRDLGISDHKSSATINIVHSIPAPTSTVTTALDLDTTVDTLGWIAAVVTEVTLTPFNEADGPFTLSTDLVEVTVTASVDPTQVHLNFLAEDMANLARPTEVPPRVMAGHRVPPPKVLTLHRPARASLPTDKGIPVHSGTGPCFPFGDGNNKCSEFIATHAKTDSPEQTTVTTMQDFTTTVFEVVTTTVSPSSDDSADSSSLGYSHSSLSEKLATTSAQSALETPSTLRYKAIPRSLNPIINGPHSDGDEAGYTFDDGAKPQPGKNAYGAILHEYSPSTLTTTYTTVGTITITLQSHTTAETTYTGLYSVVQETIVDNGPSGAVTTVTQGVVVTATDAAPPQESTTGTVNNTTGASPIPSSLSVSLTQNATKFTHSAASTTSTTSTTSTLAATETRTDNPSPTQSQTGGAAALKTAATLLIGIAAVMLVHF